jgi:RNA polymerase sigma factor (sigma-70 family)
LGKRIECAINSLQDNYRNVMKLRYYDDLDYDEISLKLGISAGHAKSQVCRARNV